MNQTNQYRRIIIRKANEYVLFKTGDIAYFYLENKTCYMQKRANRIKAVFELHSSPGAGTRYRLRIPVSPGA